jgi:hypothetical protein
MGKHYTVTKLVARSSLTELNLASSDAARDGWVINTTGFAHLDGQFTFSVSAEVEEILMPLGSRVSELLSMAQDLYGQRAKEMYSSLRLPMDAQVVALEPETLYHACTSAEQGHFEFDGCMFALAKCYERQFDQPFLAVIRYHRPLRPALQSHSVYQQ